MGTKLSRQCPITYEEAIKRVSTSELSRLRDAFKRLATQSGTITRQTFIKDVLGDTFPSKLAEHIYQTCGGGAKGLSFKELLCGLVLLTTSTSEEKIRFIFLLYANEAGTHVVKNEMVKFVQDTEDGCVPEAVADCFLERDAVCFEDFAVWLLTHEDATCLTRWLLKEPRVVSLSNDLDTPTFYQTLAGVTHLEESDILELEKRYWILKSHSKSGKFDLETLTPLVSPPLPLPLCKGLFNAFDENRDNHIDFKEMACGISACCRGPHTERQKFCFKVFDQDRDGFLNRNELETMITALLFLRKESKTFEGLEAEGFNQTDVDKIVQEILFEFCSSQEQDERITMEEYLVWTVSNHLPLDFTNLLFQICHIVLGLKPSSRMEEADIIRGWIKREDKRGMRVGQFWYLINIDWWRLWNEYVDFVPTYVSSADKNYQMPSPAHTLRNKLANSNNKKTTLLPENGICMNGGIGLPTNSSLLNLPNSHETNQSSSDVSSTPASWTSSLQQQQSGNTLSVGSSIKGSITSLLQISTESFRTPRSSSPSPNHSPRLSLSSPGSTYPQRPPAIDNTSLIIPYNHKVMMLTCEGGRLKRNVILTRGRDFELVPEAVWRALSQWYGGSPALPRQVIMPSRGSQPDLELYPVSLQLYRHQNPTSQSAASMYQNQHLNQTSTPKRYLAYVAAFSRLATVNQVSEYICSRLRLKSEDMRLWLFQDDSVNMCLLEDETVTLEQLSMTDTDKVLIEVRNKDQTWPEEMCSLMSNRTRFERKKSVSCEKGLTGLNNLGNTCFMNAALQCVSNTAPLTKYFNSNKHLFELNRGNPLGMKGHVAKRYGDLVQEIWSGTTKTIAPLKLRWTIGKCAPRFNGFQQHDCQELLAFLLDGLHEDLNRVHEKSYSELKDSDGRSDTIVAQEAWENHILRNKSIIVDLFHGQLKSKVTCKVCGHTSVRFDPFNYLSLPLPMESYIHIEVVVIKQDGSVPVKYGLRLNQDGKYSNLKEELSKLCNLQQQQMLLAEVSNSYIKSMPADDQKIKFVNGRILFAYEVTPVNEFTYDCDSKNTKEAHLFADIQRTIPRKLNNTTIKMCNNASSSQLDDKHADILRSKVEQSSIPNPRNESSSNSNNFKHLNGHIGGSTTLQFSSASLNNVQHSRQASNASSIFNGVNPPGSMTSSMISNSSQIDNLEMDEFKVIVAYHRKMMRQDVYFLSSQKTRPSMFGQPIILPLSDVTTNRNIYELVWTQVSRLISPLPPAESTSVPNHAQDCDDSLGYEYPFVLRAVINDGLVCAWCPWFRFCRGCKIECNNLDFEFGTSHIAIDWDPTALHLRYQTSQEKICIDHESVNLTRKLQTEPIDLNRCLHAFTKDEELDENEKYYCSKCKQHQLAYKKLQIWRLPPILIVHLKRFQLVQNHWIKSQKIVKFPAEKFCLTPYLSSIPKHAAMNALSNPDSPFYDPKYLIEDFDDEITSAGGCERCSNVKVENDKRAVNHDFVDGSNSELLLLGRVMTSDCACAMYKSDNRKKCEESFEDRFGSVSSCDVSYDSPQDFHQHRLKSGVNPFILNYNLYSISCHTGILGGGHYVCYAKSNNKWYCFNDSSCKEVKEDQLDTDSAYILFYEREGIDYNQYMPTVNTNVVPDTDDIEEEMDSDFKKVCSIL